MFQAEFVSQIAPVKINRCDGKIENIGNFLGRFILFDQRSDFYLLGRQDRLSIGYMP